MAARCHIVPHTRRDEPRRHQPRGASDRQLRRANGPLYRQLANVLREPIADGSFPVGASLPKEAEIADRFGISLITVRQALRELAADGLIRKRSAKPAVIAAREPPIAPRLEFPQLRRHRRLYRERRARRSRATAGRTRRQAREIFGLRAGERCFCLRGILIVRGRPDTQVTTLLPARDRQAPDAGGFRRRPDLPLRPEAPRAAARRRRHHGQGRARRRGAWRATSTATEGSPVLADRDALPRREAQEPIEFTIARHRGDTYTLTYDAPNDIS